MHLIEGTHMLLHDPVVRFMYWGVSGAHCFMFNCIAHATDKIQSCSEFQYGGNKGYDI